MTMSHYPNVGSGNTRIIFNIVQYGKIFENREFMN